MESWRRVLRDGAFPWLSDRHLEILEKALATDDPCLLQGATTMPPPLSWPPALRCEGACLLGYGAWKGDDLSSVEEVEVHFAQLCFNIDNALGEPAACRWLINYFDDTPRTEAFRELLAEVRQEMERRGSAFLLVARSEK